MGEFVGALDQGTTSTRFAIFDRSGASVASHQLAHRQALAHPGWVEHDAMEIWEHTNAVVAGALSVASLGIADLAGIGIANQRETTVVWERDSGSPVAPAIVWQDTRTAPAVAALVAERYGPVVLERTGLPLTTYSSASKLAWTLDQLPHGRRRAERGEILFGTIDSWLVWKMTGHHVTDLTNASRTMLMDLAAGEWDDELLEIFAIPRTMLPRIGPSTRPIDELVWSDAAGDSGSVSVTGTVGDQQGAMIGQGCFARGDVKNTYGTGNFLLVNTGDEIVRSSRGLISTVAYQFGQDRPVYALEGAIAVTGSAVQWLRDQLAVISSVAESEALAATVDSTEGLYFVPAFSGLFAPYWRSDARGVIIGMTRHHGRAHLARAALEAVAFQSRDVLDVVAEETGGGIEELRVDGGMTANALCMQIQADVLGVPVVRAAFPETTVRGAAFAAGLGARLWENPAALPTAHGEDGRRWEPTWGVDEREERYAQWRRAVARTFDPDTPGPSQ